MKNKRTALVLLLLGLIVAGGLRPASGESCREGSCPPDRRMSLPVPQVQWDHLDSSQLSS